VTGPPGTTALAPAAPPRAASGFRKKSIG
jgi:hypothetical protein